MWIFFFLSFKPLKHQLIKGQNQKSNFHSKYLWWNWQRTVRFLSLKKNFYKNFTMWKQLLSDCGKPNQFAISDTNGKSFFKTEILSKTGTLLKLTKNRVTIPSSVWTEYLGLHWHDLHPLFPRLYEHNNWIGPG